MPRLDLTCLLSAGLLYTAVAAKAAPMDQETIEDSHGELSMHYLGGDSYPEPDLTRITNGHLEIIGNTGAWASQSALLSVVANVPYSNHGPMGGFWDPNYRTAYDGQDSVAAYLWNGGRTPVVVDVGVNHFTKTQIVTPSGNRTVYLVQLGTPLTAAQIRHVAGNPPNQRIETNNGFFAYLIPQGYATPGGVAVSPVSADGITLAVDNWTRVRPEVAASANAQPDSYPVPGGGGFTVTIDALHQIDDSYGGWIIGPSDLIKYAIGDERIFINNKPGPLTPLNLAEPLASPLVTLGHLSGVVANASGGTGTGLADTVCSDGWQACFIARNATTAASGPTYGVVIAGHGPDVGIVSTAGAGKYLIVSDPGNSCDTAGQVCRRTVLMDNAGNAAFAGNLGAMQVTAAGIISSGKAVLGAAPGCGAAILGAHFVILDGRKPGEADGAGSGVPADCLAPAKGEAPRWISIYDHRPVVK